jgi:hypothetical protein
MFNSTYSKEWKLKYPVGDTIKVPYPQRYDVRNGLEYNPPAAAQRFATVSIGEPFGIDVPEIDSLEAAISVPGRDEFSRRYLDPATTKLAEEIERRCATFAFIYAGGLVGALGTNATTYAATSGAARVKMQQLAAGGGERAMIMPPDAIEAITAANIGLMNPQTDISKTFRTGAIGQTSGFDWYESMMLVRHTAGTLGAHTITVTTAPSNGATTLALTCTTNDTVKAGDKFSIASVLPVHPGTKKTFGTTAKTFSITAAGTAASSAITVSLSEPIYYEGPYQNVDTQPAASAVVTMWPGTSSPSGKTGNCGLALPQDAFALVGLELELFKDQEVCTQQRDPDSGIAIRFTMGSDIKSSKRIRRFDTCIGFGALYNELAHVVACA